MKSAFDPSGQNHHTKMSNQQLSREMLRIAMDQNIEIIDDHQNDSSNEQQNAESPDDVMETVQYFETEFRILRKNSPEAVSAPPMTNPNAKKPDAAKPIGTLGALAQDIPTTSTDQNDVNLPDNTGNVSNSTENSPSNTNNTGNATRNETTFEAVSSANQPAVKPNHSNTGSIWPLHVTDQPTTSITTFSDEEFWNEKNIPNTLGVILAQDIPTTSTDQNDENLPDNTDNVSTSTEDSPSNANNTGNATRNETTFEDVSSANPLAMKPNHSNAGSIWPLHVTDQPTTSIATFSDEEIWNEINSPNFHKDLTKFCQFNLQLFGDQNMMEENERDDSLQSMSNEPSLEIPTETQEQTQEETLEEPVQEMLDAHFKSQQYVVQDREDTTIFHTIKIGMLVQLSILPNFEEEQSVLLGIYHSHPRYVSEIISGADDPSQNQENNTPFSIFNMEDIIYKDVEIPFMKITLKGALVKMKKGMSQIPLKFHLTSTNLNNHGKAKDGKEWHMLAIPVSKSRAQNMRNSSEPTELVPLECIPLSKLRIQVCKEARGNKKLKKQHRNQEIEWPLHQTLKRKRLELEYFEIKKRKLLNISDEQLKRKIALEKTLMTNC